MGVYSNAYIKTADVVFREDLYPRLERNPGRVQVYAENLDVLPPIELNQHNVLIDGWHRWTAFKSAGREEVPYQLTETESDTHLLALAVARNATHGLQLTPKEKRGYARMWWGILDDHEIIKYLSISERTFREWTKNVREEHEQAQKERAQELWLACHTERRIADLIGEPQQTVHDWIVDFTENGKSAKIGKIYNFEEDGWDPKLYTVWNFPKATNTTGHFGNIPPEILENLLYYYTKPFDVVFDPFGGGGITIDVCKKRGRRHYVSDLNPIDARAHEIRRWDITEGFPKDLPVPDLVFLDPPYWKQAEGKYSSDKTDLSNVDLAAFLKAIGTVAKQAKRKWTTAKRESGLLALIIGAYKQDGAYVQLPHLAYDVVKKYLPLKIQIDVPYNTQVHGGAFVKMAKEKRELLYLNRYLMVFEYNREVA